MQPTGEVAPPDAGYAAFISYSHADKPVGRWLKRALVDEIIPAPLRRRLGWARKRRRIGDVFLDESSVAASPSVSGALQEALDRAEALILVCSPASAASDYVNLEVQRFLDLGRRERIFCLIAAGRPLASLDGAPAEECFPRALVALAAAEGKGSEPLAANYGAATRADRLRARDQLLCGLLAVSQDELNAARNRAALVRGASIAAGAAVAAAAAYGGAWAYLLPSVSHAKSYVRVWGGWREVDKIPATQAHARPETYQFHRNGALNAPTEIRLVDGAGNCPTAGIADIIGQTFEQSCSNARACSVRLAYNRDGSAKTETLVSQYGRTLETVEYSSANTAVFTEAGFLCDRSKGGINYLSVERHADGADTGRDKTVRFIGEGETRGAREPRPNDDGAFGFQFAYDAAGRVTRKATLDAAGAVAPDNHGVAATEFAYSPAGDLTERSYRSATGALALAASGAARTIWTVDRHGAALSEQNFDAAGSRAENLHGVSSLAFQRDARGNPVSTAFFDAAGKATLDENFAARIERTFDASGFETRTEFFGPGQARAPDKKGCAGYTHAYDPFGGEIERVCLDASDKITTATNGVARWRYRLSPTGGSVEEATFSADDAPTLMIARDGDDEAVPAHLFRFSHDDRGRVVGTAYFDTLGRPMVVRNIGVHRGVFALDDAGNRISLRSFDDAGAPAIHLIIGCFEERYEYDRRGNEIRRTCHDQNGAVTQGLHGAAEMRFAYNARNQLVEQTYFDASGAPTADESGVYGIRVDLDPTGQTVRTFNLGADGAPSSANSYGCAVTAAPVVVAGLKRIKTYLCFDEQGRQKPISGQAVKIISVSEHENEVELTYADANDRPVPGGQGYARVHRTFDARGLETVSEYFGADGKPWPGADYGAKVLSAYDVRRNLIERRWLDADGKLIPNWNGCPFRQWEYDAAGNQTAEICAGSEEQPPQPKDGVYVTRTAFNPIGKAVRTAYFGKAGEPVAVDGDYAQLAEYDARGCLTRTISVTDPQGDTTNALVAVRKNDSFCRERERSYERNGKPALSDWGRAFMEVDYDPAGRMTEERSLDANRRLMNLRGAAYAVRKWAYTPGTDTPSLTCFSATGDPASCADPP